MNKELADKIEAAAKEVREALVAMDEARKASEAASVKASLAEVAYWEANNRFRDLTSKLIAVDIPARQCGVER